MGAKISIAFTLEKERITVDFPQNMIQVLFKCEFMFNRIKGLQIEGYTDIERNEFSRWHTKPNEDLWPREKIYDPTIFLEWKTKWDNFEAIIRCYERHKHMEVTIDIDEEDVDRKVPDSERRIFVSKLIDCAECIFKNCRLKYLYIDEEAEAVIAPSDFSYTINGLMGITLLSSELADFDDAIKDTDLKHVIKKSWGAVLIKRWDPDPLIDFY